MRRPSRLMTPWLTVASQVVPATSVARSYTRPNGWPPTIGYVHFMQRPSANQATPATSQHQHPTIWLGLQTHDLIGRQAVLSGIHLKAAPVVRGKPPTKCAEQKPTVGVFGNGHDRQIGQDRP